MERRDAIGLGFNQSAKCEQRAADEAGRRRLYRYPAMAMIGQWEDSQEGEP